MKLSRHAKNALRRLQKALPGLSETALMDSISSARVIGTDRKGNTRLSINWQEVELEVVVDMSDQTVVTFWRK